MQHHVPAPLALPFKHPPLLSGAVALQPELVSHHLLLQQQTALPSATPKPCAFTCVALCFMAQAPLLPYLIDKLGAKESNTYGLLMSTFSALQLVGSLLSGW